MGKYTWPSIALKFAITASENSEDPFSAVGCCILRSDNSIASIGYNGPPSKVEIDWTDRDKRRFKVNHAEKNALKYVTPKDKPYLAAVTLQPCPDCLVDMFNYGIKEVYFRDIYETDRTNDEKVKEIANEFGIKLVQLKNPILK